MKRKKLNKKLGLSRETIANLDNVLMEDVHGRLAMGTGYMTCDGEEPCDTDRTCNDPDCQAAVLVQQRGSEYPCGTWTGDCCPDITA
ncbi:MAG: hypothetical protein GY940_00695 [bacterium]|nr:hypothetical protein [bacterium]